MLDKIAAFIQLSYPAYNNLIYPPENQNLFVISAGRAYNDVKPLIENYNLDVDYIILLNGALIIENRIWAT